MVDSVAEARVAVVGLGLMGGSLAAALVRARACREVVGVARRSSTLRTALDLQVIDRGTVDLEEGVADADVVVLATPVGEILDALGRIGGLVPEGCLVTDVGSTKGAICRAMEALPQGLRPIGGHPMCGKESSGLAMADPNLYRDRVWVLCPLGRTPPEARALAEELVGAVGSRPLYLEPERHDRLVAAVSHLPYLLAAALVGAAEDLVGNDPAAWRVAASGFRDTTRLAATDLRMITDVLATNRSEIVRALDAAHEQIAELRRLLADDDKEALHGLLAAARDRRLELYP